MTRFLTHTKEQNIPYYIT